MPWAVAAAAVTAGGSLLASSNSASASKAAANQVSNAQNATLGFQQSVYNNTTANLQPYVNTGQSALNALSSLYGLGGTNTNAPVSATNNGAMQAYNNFTQTPAYQFQFQQGQLAANRGLAAEGLTGSGAQAKALTQYGQGYASSGFNSYISQLASLAGLGENSAVQVGTQGNQAAGTVAGANTASGNAQGAGILGANNATNTGNTNALGALGGTLNNTNVQNFLTNLTGSSYAAGTGTNGYSSSNPNTAGQ